MCGFGRGGYRLREREKEREKREATIRSLNTPGSTSDRTLSGLTRHCPGQSDFVPPGLSVRNRDNRLGFFFFKRQFLRIESRLRTNIYVYRVYIVKTWSSSKHYIKITMLRAT
jgi:hypothetical protein